MRNVALPCLKVLTDQQSSKNPPKRRPSYFGEQPHGPCTVFVVPGLKGSQEDGEPLQKTARGTFRSFSFPYAFNGDGAETGHNLTFSTSKFRKRRHERANTHTSPTTSKCSTSNRLQRRLSATTFHDIIQNRLLHSAVLRISAPGSRQLTEKLICHFKR